ncbi:unnamed protein product, partial [Tenebrio molitor]
RVGPETGLLSKFGHNELEQYWGDKRIFRIGIYKSSSVRIYRVFDKFINELVLSWIETNTAEVWMQFYCC